MIDTSTAAILRHIDWIERHTWLRRGGKPLPRIVRRRAIDVMIDTYGLSRAYNLHRNGCTSAGSYNCEINEIVLTEYASFTTLFHELVHFLQPDHMIRHDRHGAEVQAHGTTIKWAVEQGLPPSAIEQLRIHEREQLKLTRKGEA